MKHIFKKNQVIITGLAVMIAVAGYLNYSGSKLEQEAALTATQETDSHSLETDTAYIDIESLDQDLADAEDAGTAEVEDTDSAEAADEQAADADTAAESGEVSDTPGEAVLTSLSGTNGVAAEAKLAREQVRAKNKETLLEVINNVNISEEQKQEAIDSMTAMTEIAEKEAAVELLLEAKGFTGSVVSITDGTADVVINQTEITDAQRAQIEDIVVRKAEISGENIVITTAAATAATEETEATEATEAAE